MNIQFNAEQPAKPSAFFADKISAALSRYEEKIARLTVQLGDEKEAMPAQSVNVCSIEAKPIGSDPIMVRYCAPTKEQAVNGAIVKLKSALEKTLYQLNHH